MKMIVAICILMIFTTNSSVAQEAAPWSVSDQFVPEGTFPVLRGKVTEISGKENEVANLDVAEKYFHINSKKVHTVYDFQQEVIASFEDDKSDVFIASSFALAEFLFYEMRNRNMLRQIIEAAEMRKSPHLDSLILETELKFHAGAEKHQLNSVKNEDGSITVFADTANLGTITFSDKAIPTDFAQSFWKGIAQYYPINPHFYEYLATRELYPETIYIPQNMLPASEQSSGKTDNDEAGHMLHFSSFSQEEREYPVPRHVKLAPPEAMVVTMKDADRKLFETARREYSRAIQDGPGLSGLLARMRRSAAEPVDLETTILGLGAHSHHCGRKNSANAKDACHEILSILRSGLGTQEGKSLMNALSPQGAAEFEEAARTLVLLKKQAGDQAYWMDVYLANTLVSAQGRGKEWNMQGLEDASGGPVPLFYSALKSAPWNFNFYSDIGDMFRRKGLWSHGWLMYAYALDIEERTGASSDVLRALVNKEDTLKQIVPLLFFE